MALAARAGEPSVRASAGLPTLGDALLLGGDQLSNADRRELRMLLGVDQRSERTVVPDLDIRQDILQLPVSTAFDDELQKAVAGHAGHPPKGEKGAPLETLMPVDGEKPTAPKFTPVPGGDLGLDLTGVPDLATVVTTDEARVRAGRIGRAIGAIRWDSESWEEPIGTGLLVAPGILVTAGHVAAQVEDALTGSPNPDVVFDVADVRAESSESTRYELCNVIGYVGRGGRRDERDDRVALLRIAVGDEHATPPPVRADDLDVSQVIRLGSPLAVVGFSQLPPADRPELRSLARQLWGSLIGSLAVTSGTVKQDLPRDATLPERFAHDANTLPGNSGSPVLDARTGRLIGLHDGNEQNLNQAIDAYWVALALATLNVAGEDDACGN